MVDVQNTDFNAIQAGKLPDLLGCRWTEVGHGRAKGYFEVRPHHMAPNGFLHAATLVALADTACGYGCLRSAPPEATGFTTVELKTNFLGTAREGFVDCEATLIHGGRSTQVWDAICRHRETQKTMALFRCTQMLLYPR